MADAQASGACGRKIVWVQVPSPALFFALRIKNWSGGPIRIALMGSVKTFRQGIFIFSRKENNSDRTFYAQYTLQKYSRKEISVIRQK